MDYRAVPKVHKQLGNKVLYIEGGTVYARSVIEYDTETYLPAILGDIDGSVEISGTVDSWDAAYDVIYGDPTRSFTGDDIRAMFGGTV